MLHITDNILVETCATILRKYNLSAKIIYNNI